MCRANAALVYPNGSRRVFMGPDVPTWVQMGPDGSLWVYFVPAEFIWVLMGLNGSFILKCCPDVS
jgi:hypothetical protein